MTDEHIVFGSFGVLFVGGLAIMLYQGAPIFVAFMFSGITTLIASMIFLIVDTLRQ